MSCSLFRLTARLTAVAVVGLALATWGPSVRSQAPTPTPTPTVVPTLAPPLVTPKPAVKPKAAPKPRAAEPPTITLPAEVTGAEGAFIAVKATTNCAELRWVALSDGLNVFPADMLKDSFGTVVSAKPGRYQLGVYGAKGDVPSDLKRCTVTVGVPPPMPVPPTPTPVPVPPGPGPVPTPAPITDLGLRVLIVEETDDRGAIPRGQLAILTATAAGSFRANAIAKCAKVDGQPEFRVLDEDDPTSVLPKVWQELMARPRTALPWLEVTDGKVGYEGPLPKTVDEANAILAKFN